MNGNRGKLASSVFFVLLIAICVFLMEVAFHDFSRISSDHPHEIVLIYDTLRSQPNRSVSDSSKSWAVVTDTATVQAIETPNTVSVIEEKSTETITTKPEDPELVKEDAEVKKQLSVSEQKPIIRYYKKSLDDQKVYELRKLGYYIHERESQGLNQYPSNAIFYGSEVQGKYIYEVASQLLKVGIEIKSIEQTRYSWKSKAIEIGTDTTIVDMASMSKEELRNDWGDK